MEKAQRLNSQDVGSVDEFVGRGWLCSSKRGNTAEEQRVIQFSRLIQTNQEIFSCYIC